MDVLSDAAFQAVLVARRDALIQRFETIRAARARHIARSEHLERELLTMRPLLVVEECADLLPLCHFIIIRGAGKRPCGRLARGGTYRCDDHPTSGARKEA